ncbi:hypothetical protein DESC_810205 [Desulfosarcina cetonica]|nr:hypothetical protein DESC_810205 [Desulfosarcina cetonica]
MLFDDRSRRRAQVDGQGQVEAGGEQIFGDKAQPSGMVALHAGLVKEQLLTVDVTVDGRSGFVHAGPASSPFGSGLAGCGILHRIKLVIFSPLGQ